MFDPRMGRGDDEFTSTKLDDRTPIVLAAVIINGIVMDSNGSRK